MIVECKLIICTINMVQAYGNKILIKKLEGSNVSSGGIVLPKARHSNWSRVESVGPDGNGDLVGQTILVHDYAGTEIDINGTVLFVIEETDIVAIKSV